MNTVGTTGSNNLGDYEDMEFDPNKFPTNLSGIGGVGDLNTNVSTPNGGLKGLQNSSSVMGMSGGLDYSKKDL